MGSEGESLATAELEGGNMLHDYSPNVRCA